MKNNNFYIIAGNISPRIIGLDNNILKEEDIRKLNDLAFIDSVTTRYDEQTFKSALLKKGLIDSYDTDVYIVRYHIYHQKREIKYYNVLFKGKYDDLLKPVAFKMARHKELDRSDVYQIVNKANILYNSSTIFKSMVDQNINYHSLNRMFSLLYDKDAKVSAYLEFRELVSLMYEYDKLKTRNTNKSNITINKDYENEILSLLPKNDNSVVKKTKTITEDDVEKIRNMPWDNKEAEQATLRGNIYDPRCLTLEDKLRSRIITNEEYINIVNKGLKR